MEDQKENNSNKAKEDQLTILRERYEDYTGLASEINRKLALGGIAVIWIFKLTEQGETHIPEGLTLPLFFLVISLAIDLLQYLIGGLVWWIYFMVKESQFKKNAWHGEINEAPNILPILIWIPFWLKVVFMITAYCFLLSFIKGKIL